MKRAGLLAGLLVLALGVGTLAQSPSPEVSPEATPLYAPDDVASTIPSTVGPYVLDIRESVLLQTYGTPGKRDFWRDQLSSLGKRPYDGVVARGVGWREGVAHVSVFAMWVEGVPARDILDAVIRTAFPLLDEVPTISEEWTEVAERQVLVVTAEGVAWPLYLYPKGEVVFGVAIYEGAEVAIEDVLAELP